MSPHSLVLAVDIGTTATKAVLFDTSGGVLFLARAGYPCVVPSPGWSEQDPDDVLRAVVTAMREAAQAVPPATVISAVCFSSQMYSILAVDGEGRPLTGCLTWMDHRAAAIAEKLRKTAGPELYRITGCPIDAIYPLAKIAWLQRQPGMAAIKRFISIKEYVTHSLFGEYAVDWSMASSTGLMDVRRCDWHDAALDAAGITAGMLSPLVSPRWTFHGWTAAARAATGLTGRETAVIGGGDGPLASLGVGAVTPGTVAVNVGTSAAARRIVRRPAVDDQGALWCYVLDEGWWVSGGIVTSGGVVVDWFREQIGLRPNPGEGEFAALDRAVTSVPPGSLGLTFIPYLTGEQCPSWQSEVGGAYLGLTLAHRREHLARATLEGVARAIARVIEAGSRLHGPVEEIIMTGGLSNCPAWLHVAADTFGKELTIPSTLEGSAAGAAVMARIVLGDLPGITAAAALAQTETRISVDSENASFYRAAGSRFERLYRAALPSLGVERPEVASQRKHLKGVVS